MHQHPKYKGPNLPIIFVKILINTAQGKALKLLVMMGHIGGKYSFDDEFAGIAVLVGGEAREEGMLGEQGEEGGAVVVLEDGLVVVADRQLREGVDLEEVGPAWMVHVVAQAGQQHGHLLQAGQAQPH
jgi:hypothetical protein